MKSKNNHSDLDQLSSHVNQMFDHLGDGFESVFDEQKKTSGVFKDLFQMSSSAVKATWSLGSMVVKHTPKVVVTVADVKRELVEGMVEAFQETKNQELDNQFEQKLKNLKLKKKDFKELDQ